MSFRENLKRLRNERGYSAAKDFAKVIGVRYSVYLKYESGEEEPKYEVLTKIADVLDVTIDELLGRRTRGTNRVYTLQEVKEAEKRTLCKVIDVLMTEFSSNCKLEQAAKTGYEREMWKNKAFYVMRIIAKIQDRVREMF